MSIFVTQPRVRRSLSGLGAYATMLPSIRSSASPMQAMARASAMHAEAARSPSHAARSMRAAEVRMNAQPTPMQIVATGMGDLAFQRMLQSGSSTGVARIVQSGVTQQVSTQSRTSADAVAAMSTTGTGTLCEDPATGELVPCSGTTAFSVEGALPGGIALVLAAAVGLTIMSMVLGKKS